MSDDAPPFYAFLEVGTDASAEEIQAQYRQLVKTYHPDQGGSEDEFKKLKSAYETLISASSRSRYNRLGHDAYVRAVNPSGWDHVESDDGEENKEKTSSHEESSTDDRTASERSSQSQSGAETGKTSQQRTTNRGYDTWGQDAGSTSTSSGSTSKRSQTDTGDRAYTTESDYSDAERTNTRSTERTNTRSNTSTTGTGGYRHYPSAPTGETDTGYPRIFAGLILSLVLSSGLGHLGVLSAQVSVIIGVVAGFGLLIVRDVLTIRRAPTRSAPAIDPADALIYALITGIGPIILLAAVVQGNLNGGLAFSRFAGIVVGGPLLIGGIVIAWAVFSLAGRPLIAVTAGALSSLTAFVIEFSPYRFWIPFWAIENEPASVIAPWVSVGPVTGFTPGWAVNFGLAIVLFYALLGSLAFFLLGFSDLLRDGQCGGARVIGWELVAAAPYILVTTWVLSGNALWALWGTPPTTTVGAALVLLTCVWPPVVFVIYAISERVVRRVSTRG
ncbi:J domain-containing protein [Halorubrum vacuolatum]|uniref:DnaJ domain-containing protein n=1 Tax=Halorubrum vacuolatum TaxID=63740 RepID=A0A238XN55_HALVU|nr:J domain-containing protein [Halorubrum vacuolatum]SNR60415.1 DnaJ domain-containing protein [Halorubrum vacuolatum]